MSDQLLLWIQSWIERNVEYKKTEEDSYAIIEPLDTKELSDYLANCLNNMEGKSL